LPLRPTEVVPCAGAQAALLAVLVPTLHNPTGAVIGTERRRQIAEVARRHRLWVIEDDVYAGLLDQPPLAAALPELGVVITSLSKTVAAGLRFGLIAGAGAPVQMLAAEIHATAWPLAPLMVDLACRWLEDGTAARRLAWQRQEVAARFALARRALAGTALRAGPPAPHLWLPLASGSEALAARARAVGVDSVAGPLFATTRAAPDGLRLSLAAARSRVELSQALDRLRRAGLVLASAIGFALPVPADAATADGGTMGTLPADQRAVSATPPTGATNRPALGYSQRRTVARYWR